MIWLTWRQFRGSAALVLGALTLAAVALAVTGPQLADILRVSGEDFFTNLSTDDTKKAVFMARDGAGVRRARGHRHLLGRSHDRPRDRGGHLPSGLEPEHHPDPVARLQARNRRHRSRGRGLHRSRDDVVGRAPGRRGAAGLHGQQPLQRPPPLAGRLRLARGRADRHGGAGPRRRRHRRTRRTSNGCGHGPHPCDDRRRPDPDAGVRAGAPDGPRDPHHRHHLGEHQGFHDERRAGRSGSADPGGGGQRPARRLGHREPDPGPRW